MNEWHALIIISLISSFVLMDRRGLPFARQKAIVMSVYFFGIFSGLTILMFTLRSWLGDGLF
jgi:hypothetical protein